jgi:uncharacterized RDD family membrane protein YckC
MDEPLDTDVLVEAPEHIVFRYRVAGPMRRSIAYVVDFVVCYAAAIAIIFVLILALVGFRGFASALETIAGASMAVVLIVMFAAQWLYSFLWEGITGRSPGKMLLGLRVLMVSGRPMGFGASALRNVLRAADVLPIGYLVGVASMALTRRFQRLGDLVAGTMVVYAGPATRSVPIALWPPPDAAELVGLPMAVPLDEDERAAIELFLRRQGSLGNARACELAEVLMDPLVRRFGFRLSDPSRTLGLLYDRAVNAGRDEAPPSSRGEPLA